MGDGGDRGRTRQAEDRYRDAPRDPGGGAAARTTNGATGGAKGGANREAKGAPGTRVAGYSRELLRCALVYAGRGIPVFPCEPGGKRPFTVGGFLEATTDEARIRRWWARWPNANVAIPTGERSGLLVLDVDAGEGTDSVALLELSRGQPPKTATAATGGGGQHLYFRNASPRELRAAGLYAREVRNSQGLLGDGLDVRGEGGYVVAPQSSTARLPVDRPVAPRRCLLAARLLEGGHLRRDAFLMKDLRSRQSGILSGTIGEKGRSAWQTTPTKA